MLTFLSSAQTATHFRKHHTGFLLIKTFFVCGVCACVLEGKGGTLQHGAGAEFKDKKAWKLTLNKGLYRLITA